MRGRIAGILALGFVAIAACDSHDLSYEYSENECSTGLHSFSSPEALCAGLKDDSINDEKYLGRGCARSLREKAFKDGGCPGDFNN